MRTNTSKSLGTSKTCGSKKKPTVVAKGLRKSVVKKKGTLPIKNVKKPNEKLMKKLEAMKKGESEDDHPPTLSETFSRLTSMVAESVICERGATAKKKPSKTSKPSPSKAPSKKPQLSVKKARPKKNDEKGKVPDKATLDKSEDLVKILKNEEVLVAFGKGIGTRRKSLTFNDSSFVAKKLKKQIAKKSKKTLNTNENKKTVKAENKPKNISQTKMLGSKKPDKNVKIKSQNIPTTKKGKAILPKETEIKKKSTCVETDGGSNSDEMTLDLFVQKTSTKVKVEKSEPQDVQIKLEKKEEDVGKPVKRSKKMVKIKKRHTESESSEDDAEINNLLAKKLAKSRGTNAVRTRKSRSLEGEQRARRLRLFGFWSGPKRHRVASLNALAKVHCLYENEAKALAPEIMERSPKPRRESKKAEKELEFERMESVVINKRTLRGAPGTRGVGKHWEMGDSTTSASSDDTSSDTESQALKAKNIKKDNEIKTIKMPPKKRRIPELGPEMDLKDMVVRKRMASLNASAILAASYSFEKRSRNKDSSGTSSDDSQTPSPASSPSSQRSGEENPTKGLSKKDATSSVPKKHFWKTKVENLKKSGKDVRSSPSPILAEFEKNLSEKVLEKERCDELHETVGAKKKEEIRYRRKDDVKKINIEKIGVSNDEYEYQSDSDTGQRKLIELRNAGGSNKKVAVIVNQDTDVTITGVYVNSTRSTHHEGYCNIAGMQYRISSTSHTQTEATAVISTSTASDQTPTSSSVDTSGQSSPRIQKSYTPLSALSSMQPPAAHSQLHAHTHAHGHGQSHSHGHRSANGCGLGRSGTGCSSAFSTPGCSSKSPSDEPPVDHHHHHHHHGHFVKREDRPSPSGYYQPAGPLIHHQNASSTSSSKQAVQEGANDLRTSNRESGEEITSDHSSPMGYTRGIPPYQSGYYPPAGYYPPPPQPAHYQPQPPSFHQHYHHHQDLCYPPGYPPGSYPPPNSYRRYLPPPPPTFYTPNLNYSSPGPAPPTPSQTPADHQMQQMIVPGGSSSYHPPLEPYPPPPPTGYYPGYSPGAGPGCFPHQPHGPSRNIPFMDSAYQSCPCPMQNCPKNVHTGPLTGECKRPGALPLPPVVLALPQEPMGAAGPPSPARGSAGMPPLSSPAGCHWGSSVAPTTAPPSAPNASTASQSVAPPNPSPSPTPTAAGLLAISDTLPKAPEPVTTAEVQVIKKRKLSSESTTAAATVPIKKRKKESTENKKAAVIIEKKKQPPVAEAKKPIDTIVEVIEAVVRGDTSEMKSKLPPVLERMGKVKKKNRVRKISPPQLEPQTVAPPHLLPGKKKKLTAAQMPKWSNGWSWTGEPFDAKVYLRNDESPVLRRCYPAMVHIEGDRIQPRDCILLKAGQRKSDLPFVAKVSALWENPEDGEMMVSLLWYYRPEHTESGRQENDHPDEIFASRHKDINSVACIEDKCFVLTYNEYCRYRKQARCLESCGRPRELVPRLENCSYPWRNRQPPGIVAPDIVFFCRKVYDFRQKRILKNPT